MKNRKYKLTLYTENDHACLQLNTSNQVVRKWYGVFAELIYDKALVKFQSSMQNINSTYLNKNQIHTFFTEITCLYQMVIYHYNIEKDLSESNLPKNSRNIAESLLLQIRINPIHLGYEDLLSYFLDEYNNFDVSLFDKTINLLIGKKLIQSIITDDGQQFFDKNIKPHDHIYFKKHKKLVDCSAEISVFFTGVNYFKKDKQKDSHIFYVNNSLR